MPKYGINHRAHGEHWVKKMLTDFVARLPEGRNVLATNEHEYYFRSDKLFGCHFLASIREYSCSFVAKILSGAGQRPHTYQEIRSNSSPGAESHHRVTSIN